MNRNAMISTGIFLVLLVAVFLTRQEGVKVGVREMTLDVASVLPLDSVAVSGPKTATLKNGAKGWTVEGPQPAKPPAGDAKKPATPPPTSPAKMVGPVAADAAAIERLTKAVTELSAGSFVTARKEKHKDLQLDAESGKKVVLSGGSTKKTSLTLIVGRSAEGGGFFMRRDGSDDVFIGKGALAAAIGRDVDGWRERSILPGAKADAFASIAVRPQDSAPYSVDKRAPAKTDGAPGKATWALNPSVQVPAGLRIDAGSLARVAQTLANLKAADYADGMSATDAGIGSAGSVVVKSDDGTTVEVGFGSLDDKKRRYAQVKGESQIFLVSGYARDNILKPLSGHRALTLFDGDVKQVKRVRFETGANVVELAKENGAWTLVAPEVPPADFVFDPASVDGKLAGMFRMKASGLAPTGTPAPTTGTTIAVTSGTDAPATVIIGALAAKADQSAKAVVSTSIDQNVYSLPSFQAKRYAAPLMLFKKVDRPPTPPGGAGGMQGLENLPPEIRKQIEAQMRSGQFGR